MTEQKREITESGLVELTRLLTEAKGERMKKVVMVDMDDTLTDASWRKKFLPQNGGSWDHFHAKAITDNPTKMVAVVNELAKQYDIVISTAKPLKWIDDVLSWVDRHADFKPVQILMRADLGLPSPEVKRRHVNKLRNEGLTIALAIDDRPDVCDMYMHHKIPAILVNKETNLIMEEVIHSSEADIRQAASDFESHIKADTIDKKTNVIQESAEAVSAEELAEADVIHGMHVGSHIKQDTAFGGTGLDEIRKMAEPIHMEKPQPMKETPSSILRNGADFFEERNKEYGYAYLKHGKIMAEFFPKGIELATAEDFFKFHLFELDIIKSNRIAEAYRKNTDHEDSWYDKMVYAAMAKSEIKPQTGE